MRTGHTAAVPALVKAVTAAFTAACLTNEEQQISLEHVHLPWTCPALETDLYLAGGRLQDYTEVMLPVDERGLMTFWAESLHRMWLSPSTVMGKGAMAGSSLAMPGTSIGPRAYRFAVPAGYPDVLEDTAGLVLSMEVAKVAYLGLPVMDFVADERNYYAKMADGTIFGVKDGVPAIESDWSLMEVDITIDDLARMPRGRVTTKCLYDHLAHMRSLLHTYRRRFAEFESVDTALQMLRYMTWGRSVPPLLVAMETAPFVRRQLLEQERALLEAIDVVGQPIADRAKLHTLHSLLVPDTLSNSQFRTSIFSGHEFPFTLADGKLDKIEAWLRGQLAQVKKELL